MRDAREKAMTEVRGRADSARESATRMADERKRTLADSVHALATAFDAAAASLTEGQQARLADWTRELSGRTHRIASYLDESDTRGLVTDLEGSAREHPTAFLGSSFAAGLAAGRFLRASQRTDTGEPAAQSVDVEFRPDAALLPDDRPEAASYGGFGNPGSGYGTTGSNVGHTRGGGFGDQGFGPTRTGRTGTGGAAMASRAAGSAPIGSGTGGLNEGGSLGDELNSTDPEAAMRLNELTRGSGMSAGSRGHTGGTSIDSGTNSDESSNPQRPTGGEGGL